MDLFLEEEKLAQVSMNLVIRHNFQFFYSFLSQNSMIPYICSVVDNASELHVGGMSSIPTPGNNFHYFLTTPHGKEFARSKPRLGILVSESNEERIIKTGNCNSIENL